MSPLENLKKLFPQKTYIPNTFDIHFKESADHYSLHTYTETKNMLTVVISR
jgi:hypothetical protein